VLLSQIYNNETVLQKIFDFAKSKVFIFNAVAIIICALTAIAIPKIVGDLNAIAHSPALKLEQETAKNIDDEIKNPATVFGAPLAVEGQILRLKAAQIEAVGGHKFWEISVLDSIGNIIKRWADIFAEYEKDKNTIQIVYKINELSENLRITAGGITANGASGKYAAVIAYLGLSVEISKLETTFNG
jgi:hypothetical protein